MHDLMDQGHDFAFMYFSTFTILAEFIMLNLVVAVLLLNYEQQQSDEDDEEGSGDSSGDSGETKGGLVEQTPVSSSFRDLAAIPTPTVSTVRLAVVT
jgi:hypothetical protein